MIKIIKLCVLIAVFPIIGNTAVIEDETGGANVSPVSGLMSNHSVDLKSVQAAFTDAGSMETTLVVRYARGMTVKLYAREYMNTHIILQEPIKSYDLGDKVNFHWVPAKGASYRGHIYFDNYNADTNLTLFGESGTVYSFYIRAIKHDSEFLPHLIVFIENPDLPVISLDAPKKKTSKKLQAGKRIGKKEDGEYLRSLKDVDVTNLDYNYEIVSGNNDLAPINIFDDGVWTYFKFADENFDQVQRLPVVFKVVDGYDNPLNVRKFKGTIIAEGTGKAWTLRHGGSHLCIRKVK